ncbi:penicillin-binding protein activator LpoB [Chryseobacterium sp. 6424]|uniref:penicillin-binding protein activator LpoB n=1 Tax=Chryseobacterium sp. 6424 TaxID=2039166 RepID=UPI001E52744C|nr:penicillin-binding protein activator LpoB [Chryseobacterium sp. 6424]
MPLFLLLSLTKLMAQEDTRTVVGVSAFSTDESGRFVGLVTEKVVEMLTNTKRFRVVDRTSADKVRDELELQKSEAFMDSKNLVEQGASMAAEKIITGHITKIPVYAIKSAAGTVTGYKASVAFQMKVVDVATGLSTDATSFEGKASDLMLSPESAVQNAMKSVQGEINHYFKLNFPVQGKVIKILQVDNKGKFLLNVGKNAGIAVGDRFIIEKTEIIEGQKYPQKIATVEVVNLAGENLSEAVALDKKSSENIVASYSDSQKPDCTLIIKK